MIINIKSMGSYMSRIPFIVLLLLIIGSCTKENSEIEGPDVDKPVIKMLSTTPIATEGEICNLVETHVIHASTNQEILLNLEFSDNVNLAQYKIDIHNNFDCHSHRSSPWEKLKIENIDGKVKKITESLIIPEESWAGNYHLQIQCLDAAGNEGDPLFYSIKIINSIDDIAPEVTIEQPGSNEIEVSAGEEIRFAGQIKDNHSLKEGRIEITFSDPSKRIFFPIQEFFTEGEELQTDFDLRYKMPPHFAKGEYLFQVAVYDRYNNSTVKEFKVKIK